MKNLLLLTAICLVLVGCDKKTNDANKTDGKGGTETNSANAMDKAKTILEGLNVADYSKSAVNASSQDASVNFNDNVKSAEGYYIHAGVLMRPCQMDNGCTFTEKSLKDRVLFKQAEKQTVSVVDVDGKKVYLLHALYFDGPNKVGKNMAHAFYSDKNYEVTVTMDGSGFEKGSEADVAKLPIAQFEEVTKAVMGQLIPKL